MRSTSSPGHLLIQLAEDSLCWPMCVGFHRTGDSTLACVREGRNIPDHMLPGRFLMRRSPQERALLADLGSHMGWPRNDVVAYAVENDVTSRANPEQTYAKIMNRADLEEFRQELRSKSRSFRTTSAPRAPSLPRTTSAPASRRSSFLKLG